MIQRSLAVHKRNRNLMLGLGWALLIAGYAIPQLWMMGAGGLLLNGYAYILMASDKRLAPKRGFRIPEASLLLIAALGGGVGALVGMLVNRHKTKHLSFLVGVPVFCILQLFLFWLVLIK